MVLPCQRYSFASQKVWFCSLIPHLLPTNRYAMAKDGEQTVKQLETLHHQNAQKPNAKPRKIATTKKPTLRTKQQTSYTSKRDQAPQKHKEAEVQSLALRLPLYQLGKPVISFRPSPYASSDRPARQDRQAMYLLQHSESAEHPAVAAADGHHDDGHRDAARPSPPRKCESAKG